MLWQRDSPRLQSGDSKATTAITLALGERCYCPRRSVVTFYGHIWRCFVLSPVPACRDLAWGTRSRTVFKRFEAHSHHTGTLPSTFPPPPGATSPLVLPGPSFPPPSAFLFTGREEEFRVMVGQEVILQVSLMAGALLPSSPPARAGTGIGPGAGVRGRQRPAPPGG